MLSVVLARLAVFATVAALGLAVAGCAGVRSQTQWMSDRHRGVSALAGEISIDGALVIADEEENRATVLANLANDGAEDELVQVRVGTVEAEPDGGPLTVPANGYAMVGPDGTRLDVEDAGVEVGRLVEVEFVFASAPRATVDAIVQADEGIYEGILD
ncbi:MAG: hypothetical protein ACODAF_04190 [Actinomycetota bacterium]